MKKWNAFTLVEVLMTLIITGFILTLCVSIVVRATNNHERKIGYHRAINNLNKAFDEYFNRVSTDYTKTCNGKKIGLTDSCLDSSGNPIESQITKTGSGYKDPVLIGKENLNSNELIMENIFKPYLSIMRTGLSSSSPKMAGCPTGATYFYTSDGVRFCFNYGKSGSAYDQFGDYTYGEMWVDINGDQMPNKTSRSPGEAGDTFPIVIMKDRFIPGHPTVYEYSRIGQAIFFGTEEEEANKAAGNNK